jgi:hypothetical protein
MIATRADVDSAACRTIAQRILAALAGYNQLIDSGQTRRAAEYAYVLARLHQEDGNTEQATHFGKEAIRLFDLCPMDTAEECACIYCVVEGIALPSSYIHQAVVRDRLKPLVL